MQLLTFLSTEIQSCCRKCLVMIFPWSCLERFFHSDKILGILLKSNRAKKLLPSFSQFFPDNVIYGRYFFSKNCNITYRFTYPRIVLQALLSLL